MRRRKRGIIIAGIITALLLFVACGSSEKPLDDKFVGKYTMKDGFKDIRTSVTLNKAGNNLLIHLQEVIDTRWNGKVITETMDMEIENAVFQYDKESNTYTLVEEKIKDIRAKKMHCDTHTLKKRYETWKNYQDLVGRDGRLTLYLTVNEARNEVVLYAYTSVGKSLLFAKGFKE